MRNLVILLMFLTGCGSNPDTVTVNMPDDIRPFYNEYFQLVDKHLESSGSIQMISSNDSYFLAQCQHSQPWLIRVNKDTWNNGFLDTEAKRVLIYHELTHCIFHSSAHSSDILSYMYPNANLSVDIETLKTQVIEFTNNL